MVFIMKIKDLIKQSYEDLKSLTINWFNILMLVVIVFILSNIITPIAGIPVGLLGGAYFLKLREEKKINNIIKNNTLIGYVSTVRHIL